MGRFPDAIVYPKKGKTNAFYQADQGEAVRKKKHSHGGYFDKPAMMAMKIRKTVF
jgi:hypothetical protein